MPGHRAGPHVSTQNGTCASCATPMWRGATSLPQGEATCRACRLARRRRPCPVCGTPFTRREARTCSRRCGQIRQNALRLERRGATSRELMEARWAKRRALKAGAVSEPYRREDIAARDRWRCGICRGRIPRKARHPHPRSLSMDHVIPLIQGGADVRANVRAAHLECNVARQARGGGEQLAIL